MGDRGGHADLADGAGDAGLKINLQVRVIRVIR